MNLTVSQTSICKTIPTEYYCQLLSSAEHNRFESIETLVKPTFEWVWCLLSHLQALIFLSIFFSSLLLRKFNAVSIMHARQHKKATKIKCSILWNVVHWADRLDHLCKYADHCHAALLFEVVITICHVTPDILFSKYWNQTNFAIAEWNQEK